MTLNPNPNAGLPQRSPASPRSQGSIPCNQAPRTPHSQARLPLTLWRQEPPAGGAQAQPGHQSKVGWLYSCCLLGLLTLSLSPLPAQAQSRCPRQNHATAFVYRDRDARCEGITSLPVSAAFKLISFTTGRFPSNPNPLQIAIPTTQTPNVEVLSRRNAYQLIPLNFRLANDRQRFQWNDTVLKTAKVPIANLRANAFVNSGGQRIYLPVILPQRTGTYQFVLDMPNQRYRVRRFQISHNGKVIFNSPGHSSFQPKGEANYTWDARKLPTGRYRLEVQVELEQQNASPDSDEFEATIQHNPQWLR